MGIEGRKISVTRWIEGERCAVRVQVDAVIPSDDPSEPCLDATMTQYLDRLQELADAGDLDELEKHGTVYVPRSA